MTPKIMKNTVYIKGFPVPFHDIEEVHVFLSSLSPRYLMSFDGQEIGSYLGDIWFPWRSIDVLIYSPTLFTLNYVRVG